MKITFKLKNLKKRNFAYKSKRLDTISNKRNLTMETFGCHISHLTYEVISKSSSNLKGIRAIILVC